MSAAPRSSLADLAERHRPELLRYLVRLLGNEPDAQDACQDALLRAHRAYARLPPEANSRAWLYRIATRSGLNVARGRARRAAAVVDLDPDALPARAGAEGRAELHALVRAVGRLPPRQRAALVLRQLEGLAYAEIATAVGGNEAAARANVYQALKRLRLMLAG